MKLQIKINYKSARTTAGTAPGDDREGMGRSGQASLSHEGREPPASPTHSLRNVSGSIKDRNPSAHLIYYLISRNQMRGGEGVCLSVCAVFIALFKGKRLLRYPTSLSVGWRDKHRDSTYDVTQRKYSEANLIRAHEYLSYRS